MLEVLDALGLTELVTSIDGISAVGAAAILAEAGAGRGRPGLRTAAWRAIWGALHHNTVYAERYTHLRTRAGNPLRDGQAAFRRSRSPRARGRSMHTREP